MIFSSTIFLFLFFPIVFLINFIARKRFSNLVLLIASLLFYSYGESYYVLLLIISILTNWYVGLKISNLQNNYRKYALISGITLNLLILGYFKYSHFFANVFNGLLGTTLLDETIHHLPIGISFFTFQSISYLFDVYKEKCSPSRSLIKVGLYISFFPQLIAGPIIKYQEICNQIDDRKISWLKISEGTRRFIYGLAKKVLIANVLGEYVDDIFNTNLENINFYNAWVATLCYTFQIYYDFSGYSDMAIGLGKIFGFNIPENFNYPYASKSISEFWRRWHISLGSWFKEYVYIPLGGNRRGSIRTYFNLIFVFFLTGLWHGASFSCGVWGLYHGTFIIIEKMGLRKILDKMKYLSLCYCFFVVSIGWVIFRADNLNVASIFIKKMFTPNLIDKIWSFDYKVTFIFCVALLGSGIIQHFIPLKIKDYLRFSLLEALYCLVIFICSIASIISGNYNPFIYFQF